MLASTAGKIEIEYAGEDKKEDDLVERLLNRAILKVFDQYLSLDSLQKVVEYFEAGWGVEVSDQMASQDYLEGIKEIPGLHEAIRTLGIQEAPADGRGDRVRPRRAAPAPEAQQGERGRPSHLRQVSRAPSVRQLSKRHPHGAHPLQPLGRQPRDPSTPTGVRAAQRVPVDTDDVQQAIDG